MAKKINRKEILDKLLKFAEESRSKWSPTGKLVIRWRHLSDKRYPAPIRQLGISPATARKILDESPNWDRVGYRERKVDWRYVSDEELAEREARWKRHQLAEAVKGKDLASYLEMARLAMERGAGRVPVWTEMDLSDEEFDRLRDQLHDYLQQQEQAREKK